MACSGLERSEREKIRKQNAKSEFIYRSSNDIFSPITPPEHRPRAPYPWEIESNLPKITKDFFRCRGNPLNPPILDLAVSPTPFADCEGSTRHGLPILSGKEGVYPVLVDLLNFVQKKTGRRVIITCGHRCPTHNAYADPSKESKTSRHQIGAEVDFYVQGLEDQPLEVVSILMQYYQEHPTFKESKEWTVFQRSEKGEGGVATPSWFNKEIAVKLYDRNEGRDLDNRHPYPYLSVQVRYDRAKKERVAFDWDKAQRGFPRG